MGNDIKKIQYSFTISDKVIPDFGVKSELLRQKVKFSSIGIEEYPHVSLSSYHKLAGELINYYKTSNFKLLICDSEIKPEQKLSNYMGYWRRNPIGSSWAQDFQQYFWLASSQNFSITSENLTRLCSLCDISSLEQFSIILEVSLFRNAIFIPEYIWNDDLYNLIYDSLLDNHAFLLRKDFLKLMISKLNTAYQFFFGYGGFDYGGVYVSMIN